MCIVSSEGHYKVGVSISNLRVVHGSGLLIWWDELEDLLLMNLDALLESLGIDLDVDTDFFDLDFILEHLELVHLTEQLY